MKNSIIVTGNLGYLGPIVVRRLREANFVVAGVDPGYFPSKLPWNYKPDLQASSVDQLPRAFWDPRAVVHLAAISNDPMSELDEGLTYDTNVKLVAQIAEVFADSRHVLASSASVYGFTDVNCIETDPVNPISTYASSKVAAERIIDLVNGNNIALRFGTLWGASPNFRVDLMVNHFVWEAIVNKKIVPLSNAKRPILHIEDAAKSIVSAVQASPETHNGIYNVVGQNINVYDAASRVGAFMNVEVVLDESKKDADGRSYFAATARAPHFTENSIQLGSEPEMTQLVSCATSNLDAPPRIEALKAMLAQHGTSL